MNILSVYAPLEVGTFEASWGAAYHTPKEIWDFRRQGLRRSSPIENAKTFLKTNRLLFGLSSRLIGLKHIKTIRGLGGHHVIFRQEIIQGKYRRPLYRAYVTVHFNNQLQVYMCKCRAMPFRQIEKIKTVISGGFTLSRYEAIARAKRELTTAGSQTMLDFGRSAGDVLPDNQISVRKSKRAWWWWSEDKKMHPAWRIRLSCKDPVEEWSFYVSADNTSETTIFQASNNGVSHAGRYNYTGSAYVYSPNPVTKLGSHEQLIPPKDELLKELGEGEKLRSRLKPVPEEAYHKVTLEGLDRSGRLNGERVRVIVPRGKKRLYSKNRDFSHVRARKPDSDKTTGFEELMVYHHIDRAIAYLEELGYCQKTGSDKADLRIFKWPFSATVYWTNVDGSQWDGAWYNHADQRVCFGMGVISDAEDGETIVHELGHAIQDHICENFGQSVEGAAMGEGFSDYFAMSFFADSKPESYKDTILSWDGLINGLQWGTEPPCQRKMADKGYYGLLEYSNFIRDDNASPHANGQIWAATLWDIQKLLGRRIANRIIVDSHFEQSPYTDFSRGARAIIHADRNLYNGAHEDDLEKIFRQRKIPPYHRGKVVHRDLQQFKFEKLIRKQVGSMDWVDYETTAAELQQIGKQAEELSVAGLRTIYRRIGSE